MEFIVTNESTVITVPTYHARNLEKFIPNGCTEPLLMNTDRGHFVVKTLQNSQGHKALINELICFKLGKLLGIPIPNVAFIKIDQELIDADERLQKVNVEPGLHFGSFFMERAEPAIGSGLVDLSVNKEDIPSIILFDQIIYNNDRTRNKGNLLFDMKNKKIIVIDHSHTFKLGLIWDEVQLKQICEEDICLVSDFHGHNYRPLLRYINGNSPFDKVMHALEHLTEKNLALCFEGVPVEWGLTVSEKKALLEFVSHRINNVDDLLQLIQAQCPQWKGGIPNV